MICPNCGYNAKDTDRFCVKCATRLVPIEAAPVVEQAKAAAAAAEDSIDSIDNAVEDKIDTAVNAAEQAVNNAEARAVESINEAASAAEHAAEEAKANAEAVFNQEPAKPFEPPIPTALPTAPKPAAEQVKPVIEAAQPAECSRLCKPLTTWGFIWRILLFCIPIFNMIPLFVMAFASGINKNSRSFARAVLILMLVLFALAACGIIYALAAFGTDAITNYINNLWNAIIGM